MSTVDKKFAERIIANNGFYNPQDAFDDPRPDNPRCVRLVEYTSAWGTKAYGATFENETPERQRRYLVTSEYIRDPMVIWSYEAPKEDGAEVGMSPEAFAASLKKNSAAPYGGMPKAEERQAVRVEPGDNLQIMVGDDGVWLHFQYQGKHAIVHTDTIGPQNPNSIVRASIDAWAEGVMTEVARQQSDGSTFEGRPGAL